MGSDNYESEDPICYKGYSDFLRFDIFSVGLFEMIQ